MKFEQLQQAKRVLIYGCGKEGTAARAFIAKKFPALRVDLYDEGIKTFSRKPNLLLFDVIVVSPGVSLNKLRGVSKKKITSVTDLFFDNISDALRRKIIGVTGTKGKSTTVKFIAEMLAHAGYRCAIGGNFGVPVLQLFNDFTRRKYDYIVVELSSYQLADLRVSPGVALFLNLFPDHLDRHGTVGRYGQAKKNIFRHQKPGDILITPKKWKIIAKGHKVILSLPASAAMFPAGSIFRAPHFLDNFGAVVALARHLHISKRDVSHVAKGFKGLPHRLEFVALRRGIRFYDDSISTNPTSTLAGIVFFQKDLGSIILGGQDRKQNFRFLIQKLKEMDVWIIVLHSETARRILNTAAALGYHRINEAKTMTEAVAVAARETAPGKICLLSTAAPSYDNFKNYEEKGNEFKRSVIRLR